MGRVTKEKIVQLVIRRHEAESHQQGHEGAQEISWWLSSELIGKRWSESMGKE